MMDTVGNKEARKEIADDQGGRARHGLPGDRLGHPGAWRGGVSDDFPLAYFYAHARTLRIADGPDEVHRFQLGRMELAKYKPARTEAVQAAE